MKKILALLLAVLMAVSFAACSDTKETSSASSSKNEETVSSSSEIKEAESKTEEESKSESESETEDERDMTTAVQITGDEQTGELPEIEGPDKFVSLFLKNPIDAYYLEEMEMASSVSMMLSVTNNAMKYWEAQVNATYSQLMVIFGENSEEFKDIKAEQTAFINDLALATGEIRENAEKELSGSMVNIEISYRLMLLYRGRAVELLCEAYNLTSEVNIAIITEAAG